MPAYKTELLTWGRFDSVTIGKSISLTYYKRTIYRSNFMEETGITVIGK